jgi:hypothetical protein
VIFRSAPSSFFLFFVFPLSERKKRKTDTTVRTMLPQAGYPLGVAFGCGTA